MCCIPGCEQDADITIGTNRYCHDCRRLLTLAAHRIIYDLLAQRPQYVNRRAA